MGLQIQPVVYMRGYKGLPCPKYVIKGSLLHKDYIKGKRDAGNGIKLIFKE